MRDQGPFTESWKITKLKKSICTSFSCFWVVELVNESSDRFDDGVGLRAAPLAFRSLLLWIIVPSRKRYNSPSPLGWNLDHVERDVVGSVVTLFTFHKQVVAMLNLAESRENWSLRRRCASAPLNWADQATQWHNAAIYCYYYPRQAFFFCWIVKWSCEVRLARFSMSFAIVHL